VNELCVTGGEPLLLPDIGDQLRVCTDRLPTTVLTNGSLLRGERLAALTRLPRDRFTVQVSVDSATPERHDRHRGRGSHARALAGARAALAAGLRVRLAATLAGEDRGEEAGLHALADELGIPPADRVIRRLARQGEAEQGLVLTRRTLLPEVCVTADGVYWHPVGATDPAMRVSARPFPLAAAIGRVREEFAAHRRRQGDLAMDFPCA
jgi:pyruvate-formate lyase-activating enzyme